jgi:hypothetical protein
MKPAHIGAAKLVPPLLVLNRKEAKFFYRRHNFRDGAIAGY